MTFANAALTFLEEGGSRRFVAPVLDHFGTTPLRLIGQEAIASAASKLYPKASNATRNRQVYTPVSAVLQHAARKGWCARPVFTRPKMSKVAIRWLKHDEAERLIAACSTHLQPLVITLLYTGARIGEVLWLDWSNVDLGRRHVTFPKTKNGEGPWRYLAHPRCRRTGVPTWPRGGGVSGSQWSALCSACGRRRQGHFCRFQDKDSVRRRMPKGGDRTLHTARLPPHVGHMALPRKPQPDRAPELRRLENSLDGHALRSHECRRACTYHRSSSRGKFGGNDKDGGENFSMIKVLIPSIISLGKGEVESFNPLLQHHTFQQVKSVSMTGDFV
jgi:Phage integrase family